MTPEHVRQNTVVVERAVAMGQEKGIKNELPHYPPLHPLLREELDSYLARWPVAHDALIFPDPAHPGQPIKDHNWRNWRKRVFNPARDRAVGRVPVEVRGKLLSARPYELGRHSYASLRLRAGMSNNLAGLVAELGHTTISQLSQTYAHEISEYQGSEQVDWVAEVRKARTDAARLRT